MEQTKCEYTQPVVLGSSISIMVDKINRLQTQQDALIERVRLLSEKTETLQKANTAIIICMVVIVLGVAALGFLG